jgi:hypothetical protein
MFNLGIYLILYFSSQRTKQKDIFIAFLKHGRFIFLFFVVLILVQSLNTFHILFKLEFLQGLLQGIENSMIEGLKM